LQHIKNIWIISFLSALALCSGACGPWLREGDCVVALGKRLVVKTTDGVTARLAGELCLGVACFNVEFDMPVSDVQDCLRTGACACED
jgi:hypothetical protein